MEFSDHLFKMLGILVVASPAMLVVFMGLKALFGFAPGERTSHYWTAATTSIGLLAALAILAGMLKNGVHLIPIELGNWVAIPEQHFHFHLKFEFDRLSVPFCILSLLLCGVVSAFSHRYLHREPGYGRFFVNYSLFTLGMVVTSVAGTVEVLFFGWELVGLSSAMLIAFFQERTAPVKNGLRVWGIYRVADAVFLMAVLMLHHFTGEGDFEKLTGSGPWPVGEAMMTSNQAFAVGLLLLIAAAGKSALIPFSGWLPRAMEGPTPSSAVFYGALSVHLGAFLLLRISPILEKSGLLCVCVIIVGLATALVASMSAKVQTDIKTALTFASLTQVGIIIAEIGFGLRYIALIHLLGHACLRTLQLLRAPTLLHDYHTIENAIGGRPALKAGWLERTFVRGDMHRKFYRFALERGYLDAFLDLMIIRPFVSIFKWCDRSERRWTDWLAGGHSRLSDDVEAHSEMIDELRH